jgi:hypothetical protein
LIGNIKKRSSKYLGPLKLMVVKMHIRKLKRKYLLILLLYDYYIEIETKIYIDIENEIGFN